MFRVLHERKRENRKQEDLPKVQCLFQGPLLQNEQGGSFTEDRIYESVETKTAEEGPSLSKPDPWNKTKGKPKT